MAARFVDDRRRRRYWRLRALEVREIGSEDDFRYYNRMARIS